MLGCPRIKVCACVLILIESYYVKQLPEFMHTEVMHENLDAATQAIYRLGEIEKLQWTNCSLGSQDSLDRISCSL